MPPDFEKAPSRWRQPREPDLPAHLVSDVRIPGSVRRSCCPSWRSSARSTCGTPDWPVERKRWVIAEQARLHRLKTTEPGSGRTCRLSAPIFVRNLTPRSDFFAAPAFGEKDRRHGCGSSREIRIRSFAREGFDRVTAIQRSADHADAYLGASDGPSFFADDGLNPGEALGRQAILYRDGAEVPLLWSEVTTGSGRFHEEITSAGEDGRGCIFCRRRSLANCISYDPDTRTASSPSRRPPLKKRSVAMPTIW